MKKIIFGLIVSLAAVGLLFSAAADDGVISYSAEYELITPASEAYPDDGVKLTDGIFGTIPDGSNNYYSSGAYVGFNQTSVNEEGNFVIIIDLGENYDDITGVTVGYLNETDAGIYAPQSMTFSISDQRNGAYTELGSVQTAKSVDSGVSETFATTFAIDHHSGRYIQIEIKHLGTFTNSSGEEKTAGWTFIDEISVHAAPNYGESSSEDSEIDSESESDIISEPESLIESEIDSDLESATETLPNEQDPVSPGDRMNITVFVLLGVSAVAMALSLFARKRDY